MGVGGRAKPRSSVHHRRLPLVLATPPSSCGGTPTSLDRGAMTHPCGDRVSAGCSACMVCVGLGWRRKWETGANWAIVVDCC